MDRLLTGAGILAPIFYYAALIGGSLTWPGYSHVTQYASELGAAAAPRPEIFNYGVIAAGVAGILAGIGFFLTLRRVTGKTLPALLSGLAIAVWGVSMIMGGLFPMPNPLHNGFGMGLAVQIAPLFLLWAVAGRHAPGLKALLVVVFLASTALLLVMFNVGELNLVRQSNVGLWQRAYSASSIPWIALAALALLGMRPRKAAAAPPVEAHA